MRLVAQIAFVLAEIYLAALFARLVIEIVTSLARNWRPRRVFVVVAELLFTITDPPLKAVRRLIKPVRMGSVSLDIAFFVVLVALEVIISVLYSLASAA